LAGAASRSCTVWPVVLNTFCSNVCSACEKTRSPSLLLLLTRSRQHTSSCSRVHVSTHPPAHELTSAHQTLALRRAKEASRLPTSLSAAYTAGADASRPPPPPDCLALRHINPLHTLYHRQNLHFCTSTARKLSSFVLATQVN
jgi:hypothetical protein